MSEQCGACMSCHAWYVCADYVRLYGQECMRYLWSLEKRAAQSAEVRPDTAQQLKAEIADLANELQDFNDRRVSAFGRVTEIVDKMRQLSAV